MSTTTTPRHDRKCDYCNRNCYRKGANHGCFPNNYFRLEQFFNTSASNSRDSLHSLQFTIFSLPKELHKQLMARLKGKFACLKREIPGEEFPDLTQYTKEKMVSMSTKTLAKVVCKTMLWYYDLMNKKDETTCGICLETIDNSKPSCTTKCGHTFCTGCFMQLLQHSPSHALSCPSCRRNQFEHSYR